MPKIAPRIQVRKFSQDKSADAIPKPVLDFAKSLELDLAQAKLIVDPAGQDKRRAPGLHVFLLARASARSPGKSWVLAWWDGARPVTRQAVAAFAKRKELRGAQIAILSGKVGFENSAAVEACLQGILPVTYRETPRGLVYFLDVAVFGKFISAGPWVLRLQSGAENGGDFLLEERSPSAYFQGKPLRNWLHSESRKALMTVVRNGLIALSYGFRKPVEILCGKKNVTAHGAEIHIICRRHLHCQITSLPVDDAVLAWIRNGLPAIGLFPQGLPTHLSNAWMEFETAFPGRKIPIGSPQLVVIEPIPSSGEPGVPRLEKHIVQRETRYHF